MAAKQRSASTPVPPVTKAPKPITPLRGSFMPPRPKPTQIPPGLPLYYPNDLKQQTRVINGKARKKFPVQTQILQLCKFVISKLTPHLCAAVRGKPLRADSAQSAMSDLLHTWLVYNCDHDAERFRLEQELHNSDEWAKLDEKLLAVSKSVGLAGSANDQASSGSLAAPHRPARDPELAKRDEIIRQNPQVRAQGWCELLDSSKVPVPKGWPFPTWTLAYKDKGYRSRIQVIISKAKKTPA